MSEHAETPPVGRTVVSVAVLGTVGLIVGIILGMVLYGLVGAPLSIPIDGPLGQLLFTVGTYAGVAAVGLLYLVRHELSFSYVRLRLPGWLALGVTALTVVVLVALAITIPRVIGWLGLPLAEHSVKETLEGNPSVALVLIPVSILIVGPAEELLYRGIIQTRLKDVFGTYSAVAVAAVLFAAVHFLAYLDPANIPGTLVTMVFLLLPLGMILGAVYEYTGNLIVPAVAHGVYNAITYGSVYADLVGAL